MPRLSAPHCCHQFLRILLWRTLRDAGLSWQKDRTWCVTGVAVRRRKKDGVVTVTDPDADAKKLERQNQLSVEAVRRS